MGKDSLAKVWDLETRHCFQTLTGHRSEVWSVDVNRQGTRMITGAADRQLRVWALGNEEGEDDGATKGFEVDQQLAVYMGSVVRESNDRCLNVKCVSVDIEHPHSCFTLLCTQSLIHAMPT